MFKLAHAAQRMNATSPLMAGVRRISTIPYHPALALGQIANPEVLKHVADKSDIYAKVDAQHDALNEMFTARRSLEGTVKELASLKIEPDNAMLQTKKDLDESIKQKALELANARFDATTKSLALERPGAVKQSIESPVNFAGTEIKSLPLSFDSLKMDVQYFKYEDNDAKSCDFANQIKAYVSGQVESLGNSASASASAAAGSQAQRQLNKNTLEGTLIISCVCTHEAARMMSPLKLDVEKLISAWNQVHDASPINMPDDARDIEAAGQTTAETDPTLKLLTGVTMGSSFIGMVHIMKSEKSTSTQDVATTAHKASGEFKKSLFFSSASGGFGVDSSSAASIKNLFSSSDITSHITLISTGVIPTIQASDGLKTVLKQMNSNETMGTLLNLQNSNSGEGGAMDSMTSASLEAKAGQKVQALASKNTESAITAVTTMEGQQDKMLDISTLMTAFTNYVEKISSGAGGVPLNYYTKTISKYQIARLWKDKYFPDDMITTPYDEGAGDN